MRTELENLENFTVLGVNHWEAPLEVREKFSLSQDILKKIYKESSELGLKDFFIVSTCNRTEVYAYQEVHDRVKYCFVTHSKGDAENFEKYIFQKKGEEAIQHLMKVAAGLDSQILGDMQILNQVKTAYEMSSEYNLISGKFHRLMQHVFRSHKRSRNETNLGEGAATVAHAAVKKAVEKYTDITDKKILIVGTGEIGKTTCKNLFSMNCKDIYLCNRTEENAVELSKYYGFNTLDYNKLTNSLNDFDIVIVSTSANTPILNTSEIDSNFERSGDKLFIDLSVPHNIDSKFSEFENVELVNMDSISNVTGEAYEKRIESIPVVKEIIEDELNEYKAWLKEQKIVPAIKALNKKFDDIRTKEFEFFKNKIQDPDKEKIEKMTKRIVSRIAAYSIEHLRNNVTSDDDRLDIIKEIYKLELDNEEDE